MTKLFDIDKGRLEQQLFVRCIPNRYGAKRPGVFFFGRKGFLFGLPGIPNRGPRNCRHDIDKIPFQQHP